MLPRTALVVILDAYLTRPSRLRDVPEMQIEKLASQLRVEQQEVRQVLRWFAGLDERQVTPEDPETPPRIRRLFAASRDDVWMNHIEAQEVLDKRRGTLPKHLAKRLEDES